MTAMTPDEIRFWDKAAITILQEIRLQRGDPYDAIAEDAAAVADAMIEERRKRVSKGKKRGKAV